MLMAAPALSYRLRAQSRRRPRAAWLRPGSETALDHRARPAQPSICKVGLAPLGLASGSTTTGQRRAAAAVVAAMAASTSVRPPVVAGTGRMWPTGTTIKATKVAHWVEGSARARVLER